MDGLLSFQGALALANRRLIVDFAAKHRIPAIYQSSRFSEAGGLMAWAPNLDDAMREAARYADRILRDVEPADLPVRHRGRYYLTVISSAAKAICLTIPTTVISAADRVLA